ncbi:PREDICTED: xylosyltransferase oxt-like, partial [Priapulus caudatus]|uniref:protein xylosyltransferase n=1 Tax=Priapulus caudatus TaxID=37621 RepID=A0ABM1F2S5_PRICU
MLLQCMSDLLLLDWPWDYFINLSESDFPIKTNEELTAYLAANKGKNFVKSHGRDTLKNAGVIPDSRRTSKSLTLQLEQSQRFTLEIETYDGGSDWVALSRDFCRYLVSSDDGLLSGLKKVYAFTLLPAESFFHTVIRNSEFCDTYVDNNLHVTNWKRKQGCKCQYKHIVDWCGCSPNDFKPGDLIRLHATESRPVYFARKFEAIINQQIIEDVETWLYGPKHD